MLIGPNHLIKGAYHVTQGAYTSHKQKLFEKSKVG